MAKVQFNPDDEPAFNPFDLPTICTGADNEERSCCAPCDNLLLCILRSPLEFNLAGIDVSEWYPWLKWTGATQLQAEQAIEFGGDATDIFHGTFLGEPPSEQAIWTKCPPLEREGCPTTHYIRAEHTIYAPTALDGIVKRLWLSGNVECTGNQIRFTVLLAWEGEPGNEQLTWGFDGSGGCPRPEPGMDCVCFPNPIAPTPYVPNGAKLVGCCLLLASEWIAIDGTTQLTDLVDVELLPVPPIEILYSGFAGLYCPNTFSHCLQYDLRFYWVCIACFLLVDDQENLCCRCFTLNPPPAIGPYPNPDPFPESAPYQYDRCMTQCNTGTACAHSYVLPPPIKFIETTGAYTVSVLREACRIPDSCGSCVPDPAQPRVAIPIEPGDVRFDFDRGSSNCTKTFTAVYPPCITPVKIYWPSIGKVGETVSYTLVDTDPDSATRKRKLINMILVDDRGCIYCYEEEVGCGCCSGVSGSLSIEEISNNELGCLFKLTANISGNEECPQAGVIIQIEGSNGTPFCETAHFGDLVCTCEKLADDYEGERCEGWLSCLWVLGPGQEAIVRIFGLGRIRYAIQDGPCGCVSDWVEVPFHCAPCENCLGVIHSMSVTIIGWDDVDDCDGCHGVNRTWEMIPYSGGCVWRNADNGAFKCDPADVSSWGVDLFVIFGWTTGYGDPALVDLTCSIAITANGGATWEKSFDDVGFTKECVDFAGFIPRIASSPNACTGNSASAFLQINGAP